MSKPLHLPDLTITGFRGIDQLSIPRLGRVTLLAGKNGVGKTTVLDAIRVYALRGAYSALDELLRSRKEISVADNRDRKHEPRVVLDAIFHGRALPEGDGIIVGPINGTQLKIRPSELTQEEAEQAAKFHFLGAPTHGVTAVFGNCKQFLWLYSSSGRYLSLNSRNALTADEPPSELSCRSLGPEMLSPSDMSRLWDSVALTEDENHAIAALNLVVDAEVARLGMVGDQQAGSERLPLVRLQNYPSPVPLKSLGDGAVRLFGLALALANSRGGFLLIDEAENGIHHSVQYDLWKMILRTAQAYDVQVLATTHSWDCVRGFAYAAAESEESDGVLVRLDRDDRGLRAVEYSEEDLKIAADQGIEVR